MTAEKWVSSPDADATPAELRGFVLDAGARIHPSSGASDAERAWLSGLLLGIAARMCDELEQLRARVTELDGRR